MCAQWLGKRFETSGNQVIDRLVNRPCLLIGDKVIYATGCLPSAEEAQNVAQFLERQRVLVTLWDMEHEPAGQFELLASELVPVLEGLSGAGIFDYRLELLVRTPTEQFKMGTLGFAAGADASTAQVVFVENEQELKALAAEILRITPLGNIMEEIVPSLSKEDIINFLVDDALGEYGINPLKDVIERQAHHVVIPYGAKYIVESVQWHETVPTPPFRAGYLAIVDDNLLLEGGHA